MDQMKLSTYTILTNDGTTLRLEASESGGS